MSDRSKTILKKLKKFHITYSIEKVFYQVPPIIFNYLIIKFTQKFNLFKIDLSICVTWRQSLQVCFTTLYEHIVKEYSKSTTQCNILRISSNHKWNFRNELVLEQLSSCYSWRSFKNVRLSTSKVHVRQFDNQTETMRKEKNREK